MGAKRVEFRKCHGAHCDCLTMVVDGRATHRSIRTKAVEYMIKCGGDGVLSDVANTLVIDEEIDEEIDGMVSGGRSLLSVIRTASSSFQAV